MNSEYINNLIIRLCKQPRTFEFISMNLYGFDPIELLKHPYSRSQEEYESYKY